MSDSTPINWHSVPRDECERAAAMGDVGAQAEVRIHQRLDRTERALAELRQEMNGTFDKLNAAVDSLITTVKSR